MIHDAHCHFFSTRFFEALARDKINLAPGDPMSSIPAVLGWEPPGEPTDLADRWVSELDHHDVTRVALMASVPGDEESVAVAVARHPRRFVGWFMLDPTREDSQERTERAVSSLGLRCICLFPAMHRYRLDDERALKVFDVAADHAGTAVFVHCGVSVRWREKETRAAKPVRHPARRSTCPLPDRHRPCRSADHRAALRRRLLPRGAHDGRPLSEHLPRHLKLQ